MTYELIAFYAFAAVTVLAALGVILARNPVHAVLSLVLTFFSAACLWLLLQAEFLGVVLVLVYIGAVMVLFLFVVMMLDINTTPLREGFVRHLPFTGAVVVVMAAEMVMLIGMKRFELTLPATDPAVAAGKTNLQWIGETLFSKYILPFETAAVILTVALVVAVMLTLRRRPGTKHQDPARQVAVRREDRVRLVKVAAEPRQEGNP
ncbi:NADH-quinone oxidoreductase subunit J [Arenimonas caeni]|jgi:NADH-quinone oxidoreductase subunit J|uniref:NADH-quinone oxidoreductase subunit J n=1 Tax=Arenimonas caeni TaxID=2058085 RepID=A0A2P6MA25_9GAMM|nr:NADH-quinone oxidoreductase subunit J [Arenimonas caeni]MDY0021796.1 NADH-quinone oxidoreductase subunit J [Arenimonas caeni]PRH82823.1 NADH-quinone oxidoreductase subunit J [Arenimonas caeni]